MANAGQEDALEVSAGAAADGVGDACDPRPSQGGDALALFEAFEGDALDPAWTTTGNGVWSMGGGQLAVDALGLWPDPLVLFPVAGADVAVETRATFTSPGSDPWVYLGARGHAGATGYAGYLCNAYANAGQGVIASYDDTFAWTAYGQFAASTFAAGAPFLMQVRVEGTAVRCTIGAGAMELDLALFDTGMPALGVYNSQARFDYLAVYALGP